MFKLNRAIEILERTPEVLEKLLDGLSDSWINNNEGDETWSPFDIIAHLVHGEKTDWIARAKIILENKKGFFKPFDRFSQFEDSKGENISQLLTEFKALRNENLDTLRKLNIDDNDLVKIGIHPDFGEVNLRQLLSTWVVHDLGHIRQIARVMAKQYKYEIGPWEEYLPVVHE